MSRVRAGIVVDGPLAAVEALWYDLNRWPSFVDGFARLVKVEGEWPQPRGRLVWDSHPGGRGRVSERVAEYARGEGSSVEVEDEQLAGTQAIAFAQAADGVEVVLTLDYRLKTSNPLRPLLDALFIRRAMGDSLRRTLTRFARERDSDLEHS